jgi:hypothetical protein
MSCYAMLRYPILNVLRAILCYAMLCYAVLCYAMLCYAMLCCTMLCYAMLCCTMLCYAMLCYAMLCCTMLCNAMLCYAMLCCAMLCYDMPCCAMLCYAMQCYAMPCCAVLCYTDPRGGGSKLPVLLCRRGSPAGAIGGCPQRAVSIPRRVRPSRLLGAAGGRGRGHRRLLRPEPRCLPHGGGAGRRVLYGGG